MPEIARYWLKEKSIPFSVFLNILQAYYHPEVYHDGFPELVERVKQNHPDDQEIRTFKEQFGSIIEGDRVGLHLQAIDTAAEFNDQTETAFLIRLWRELYPEDEIPTSGGSPASA